MTSIVQGLLNQARPRLTESRVVHGNFRPSLRHRWKGHATLLTGIENRKVGMGQCRQDSEPRTLVLSNSIDSLYDVWPHFRNVLGILVMPEHMYQQMRHRVNRGDVSAFLETMSFLRDQS